MVRVWLFTTTLLVTLILSGCASIKSLSTKDDIDRVTKEIEVVNKNLTTLIEKSRSKECLADSIYKSQQEFIDSIDTRVANLKRAKNITIVHESVVANSHESSSQSGDECKKDIVYGSRYLNGKIIVGAIESVSIEPPGVVASARIDTGAQTSSLDARDLEEFERDGTNWVRFNFVDRLTANSHEIEAKVIRYVKITQSSNPDGYDKRPVVRLKLTMGDFSELSEFTLTSREHMSYPILIGRNALQDVAVVDVSSENLAPLISDDKELE